MVVHQNQVPTKPARVVVIGANGFIGRAIHRRLKMEDIPTLALASTDINLLDASACERLVGALRSEDVVVMLATLTPDKGRDIPTLIKNLTMMQSVCAALEKTGCAHLVYFSSEAVYPGAQSRVTEETPAFADDHYGTMHYTREVMARSLGVVSLLILRPALVYGVEDTHNSYGPNRFRRVAQSGGKITLFGNGEETRDHIHVDDIADLTVHCLNQKSTGTLNLATGASRSFREVAEIVAGQFDRKIEIVPTERKNPVTHRHYDVTNLIKAFPGFQFATLEEGIARVHQKMLEAV